MTQDKDSAPAPPATDDRSQGIPVVNDQNLQRASRIDRFGALAGLACAGHCAVCSLLPGVLAAIGFAGLLSHEAEWAFTLVAVLSASTALFIAWREGSARAVGVLLAAGIIGLLAARWLEHNEIHGAGPVAGILAGLTLVAGHLWNLRARRQRQG
ncbi:MAG: MerC domain-containing protein [Acidobacteriota bacterium]